MSTNWFHIFVVVLGFSSSELNFLITFCSFKVVAQFLPKRMLHRSQFYLELRGHETSSMVQRDVLQFLSFFEGFIKHKDVDKIAV